MWYYDGHHIGGMHWIWWLLWVLFLFFIFAIPYDVPGQQKKKDSPLDILKRRLTTGEINNEEYVEYRKVLDQNETE